MLLTTAAWPPGLDSTESYAIWTSNMSSNGLLISDGREQVTNSLESLDEFGNHSGALCVLATPLSSRTPPQKGPACSLFVSLGCSPKDHCEMKCQS